MCVEVENRVAFAVDVDCAREVDFGGDVATELLFISKQFSIGLRGPEDVPSLHALHSTD